MKTNLSIVLALFLASSLFFASAVTAQQETPPQQGSPAQEDIKKQLGTIIVTPGNGPNLALADFVARSQGVEAAVATFNEVLLADLEFAAVSGIVGKSLYPKSLVPDPASLKFEEWSADPVKADYLAFGNLQSNGGLSADTYLFDVKTKQQLIASRHTGDARRMAHEFADEIVKLLTGRDGIATSRLAYVSGDSIRAMDYDGFNQRGFASDGPIVRFPQFSPDGRYLAYVSYKSGVANIVVRSSEGGLVGGTNYNSTTTSPSISPGGQLAFSSAISNDGSMEIYVSNLDGGSPRRLTRTQKGINISPRWNPRTGREIAFISNRSGSPQIYVMDSSGANQRPLISRGGHSDSPSWSPDGRYIAFTYGGAGSFQIFVADVASGQLLQLTSQGRNESPTWSPDGRHLAFQSNRSGRWEIWQTHIDGTGQRQVTRGGGRLPAWGK